MKNNWTTAKLGEICHFKNGLWKGKKEPYTHVGVIRNTNFTKEGFLDDSDIAYLDVESKQYETRKLQFGDIILEKSGGGPKQAVGRVVYFDKENGEYSFSNFTSVVRVINSGEINSAYLHRLLHFYYMSGFTESMQKHSTGIRNLQLKEYKEQQVPLPPIPEQKRIVALLNEAFEGIDAAIANTEKNLANARELFDSYLNDVFTKKGEGWVEKSVGELADHRLGKMLDKRKNKGSLKPYLRNKNVQWFDIDKSDVLEMRIEEKEIDRYSIKKGDLLICEGGYPGRSAIWEGEEEMFFQKALHRVRCKTGLHNLWILYYLYLSDVNGDLRQHFTGAGIQHFTGNSLKKFTIPIGPERVVAEALKNIEHLDKNIKSFEVLYKRKLIALAELKQSLLAKAFSGELTADSEPVLKEAVG